MNNAQLLFALNLLRDASGRLSLQMSNRDCGTALYVGKAEAYSTVIELLSLADADAPPDADADADAEHPRFHRQLWCECVARDDTISGYWTWVRHQVTSEEPVPNSGDKP